MKIRVDRRTVEPHVIHTPQWTAKAMSYWGVMGYEGSVLVWLKTRSSINYVRARQGHVSLRVSGISSRFLQSHSCSEWHRQLNLH